MGEGISTGETAPGKSWVGQYNVYPDRTSARRAEGGLRLLQNTEQCAGAGPLVSIVTVVYNCRDTLERTITSVLRQDYKNIEYIIIDGGSDDGTLEIIEKYKEKISYYVSEPDRGVYNAMNKGISLAKGDYVCILNADDYYADDFISASILAAQGDPDIICGSIEMNGTVMSPKQINTGIYFGHLNYFHGTFLVKRSCYDTVGPYDEDYRIVSDTKWVQRAFTLGQTFQVSKDSVVHFSEGGLSSGNTPQRRELLFDESASMYKETFPFLAKEDASLIYLFRFNKKYIEDVTDIARRYAGRNSDFLPALSNYVSYCLSQREAFIFGGDDFGLYFHAAEKLLKELGLDLKLLQVDVHGFDHAALIEHIDECARRAELARDAGVLVILHYAQKFSTKSETFIYDLLLRMQTANWSENFILCDERRLKEERPYENGIEIPWPRLPAPLREALYKRLFTRLAPDVLICHFAASGRWLYSRIGGLNTRIPTVHMTHGIDVFAMDTNEEYRNFVRNRAVIDPQTQFTAVSNYLAKELISRGVPENKITVIPNVAHPRFFQNRKTSAFYDGARTLEILNIGRLIDLKGHRFLLGGLKDFISANPAADVKLTIVYGGDDRDLVELQGKIGELGLKSHVELVAFVDFDKSPDYFAQFDLFIMSSTYSNDAWKRSESFGMVTLEAIASGLPVIVTNAGGSPEIVGEENRFAKIVNHGDAKAIGKAIDAFYNDRQGFADNLNYAMDRLACFSEERQLSLLRNVIDRARSETISAVIFSSIAQGGAGGAALRVHESLLLSGVKSTFYTRTAQTVERMTPFVRKLEPDIKGDWDALQTKRNKKPGHTIFTVNEPRLFQETIAELVKDADVINIHWVARMLSAENIAYLSRLGKPLVITVRDMQPLTGGCHFFHGCDHWRKDCDSCPQLIDDEENLPHLTQTYKLQNWDRNNITVVALSSHSAKLIEKSPLFEGCRLEIIANPIDLDVFKPVDRIEARSLLDLPQQEKIAFYLPSFESKVKGRDEFRQTMEILRKHYPDFQMKILVAGSGALDVSENEFLFDVINLGKITDKRKLAAAFSAADITIVPSLEETFSNTAAESVACGTPVVGFATGAIGDIAERGRRGAAVNVGDCPALADAIVEVISGKDLRENCRKYALDNFSFEGQGRRYADLFQSLAAERSAASREGVQTTLPPLLNDNSIEALYARQIKTQKLKIIDAVEQETSELTDRIKMLEGRLSHIKAMATIAAPKFATADEAGSQVHAAGANLLAWLRSRNIWAYRIASAGMRGVHLARRKKVLTFGVLLGIAAILIAPLTIEEMAGFPRISLFAAISALAMIFLVAGFFIVMRRIRILHQIIHSQEEFRKRLLNEFQRKR